MAETRRKNWRFKLGIVIIKLLYFVAIFADFFGPYSHLEQIRGEPSAPASSLHFVDENGSFHIRPFIYRIRLSDPRTLEYEEVKTEPYPVELFAKGPEFDLLWLIPSNTHLFGVANSDDTSSPRVRLLGSDQLGRDKFSRLLRGMRFSLLVVPAGAAIALLLGVVIGGSSGYSGRTVDAVLMGVTDTMLALPALILILAARAAFPIELSAVTAAWMLILIFGLTSWGEMARLVRGLVWSLRNREFVLAARASGSTEVIILLRHIMPNIMRPVLVQATLMLPALLLAEVAMSFLGVGVQEPEPSLGNMLGAAADLIQIQQRPVGLIGPVVVIMLFLIGTKFIGSSRTRGYRKD